MVRRYGSGEQFLADNEPILQREPLATLLFTVNASRPEAFASGCVLHVTNGQETLLCMRIGDFPTLLYGNERLCGELVAALADEAPACSRILGGEAVCEAFCKALERRYGGTHRCCGTQEIMQCSHPIGLTAAAEAVSSPTGEEIGQLAALIAASRKERSEEQGEAFRQKLRNELACYAVLRREGRIVAMARTTHETPAWCGITGVYTAAEFRRQGLARQVVAGLTDRILREGRCACLFVERSNTAARELYRRLGYTTVHTLSEFRYTALR